MNFRGIPIINKKVSLTKRYASEWQWGRKTIASCTQRIIDQKIQRVYIIIHRDNIKREYRKNVRNQFPRLTFSQFMKSVLLHEYVHYCIWNSRNISYEHKHAINKNHSEEFTNIFLALLKKEGYSIARCYRILFIHGLLK